MRTLLLLAVGLLACPAASSAQPVTLDSLLQEMIDRASLARLPSPAYTGAQASSYDRASTTPTDAQGWFANGDVDKFVREEQRDGHTEYVLMDVAGPGAVVRLWSANPPEGALLRFYFDGQETPGLVADMQSLLGGQCELGGTTVGEPLSGVQSKGWNLYLPIPYANHCKVTCDKRGFYYQVNYRTYAPGTAVVTFERDQVSPGTVRTVGKALLTPANIEAAVASPSPLAPGERRTILSATGPGAVDELRLACESLPSRPSTLIVEAKFDGERCVWMPLTALAGGGDGLAKNSDFFRTTNPGRSARVWWVMPYRQRAEITLINLSDQTLNVAGGAHTREWAWDDRSMHFHGSWRQQYPLHTKKAQGTSDWNYVEIAGQGVYVGDSLSVVNPVPAWWGEGDEKIYIDGEAFPSHFGTGTEDYYGYAWCWPEPFLHPFHSQPRADGWVARGKKWTNWGHTTVSRVRSLDAIPFTKSLKFDMEAWHWAETDVAYAASAFWYARPGATSNRGEAVEEARLVIPEPAPLPKPIAISGAVECEAMKIAGATPGISITTQETEGYAPQTWSGGEHLWVQAEQVGQFVELAIPCEGSMARVLTLYATKSWDYGIINLTVNGQPGAQVDLWSGKQGLVSATGPIALGTFVPQDGVLVIRAEVVGSNPGSMGKKHFFGLDCVVLAKP